MIRDQRDPEDPNFQENANYISWMKIHLQYFNSAAHRKLWVRWNGIRIGSPQGCKIKVHIQISPFPINCIGHISHIKGQLPRPPLCPPPLLQQQIKNNSLSTVSATPNEIYIYLLLCGLRWRPIELGSHVAVKNNSQQNFEMAMTEMKHHLKSFEISLSKHFSFPPPPDSKLRSKGFSVLSVPKSQLWKLWESLSRSSI